MLSDFIGSTWIVYSNQSRIHFRSLLHSVHCRHVLFPFSLLLTRRHQSQSLSLTSELEEEELSHLLFHGVRPTLFVASRGRWLEDRHKIAAFKRQKPATRHSLLQQPRSVLSR